MTITGNEAYQSILARRQSLGDGVARRAAALRDAVQGGPGWEPAVAALVAYLAEEVLPHTAAEEEALLRPALSRPELSQPVATMIDEHTVLAKAAERLATAGSDAEADALAATISSLFTTHVQKENDVILPLLSAEPGLDLPALVGRADGLSDDEDAAPDPEGKATGDTVATLTSLLLGAASDLADAGQGDRACRLAAATWAVLRTPQPRLAVRVTAKLHKLVRVATAEPVRFTSGPPAARPAAEPGVAELDVRSLAPAQRHEKIFATYAVLTPGRGFVLVNDHDPKPLRYQFEAEHTGDFTWEPIEQGPEVWRVRIGRPELRTGAR